MIRTLAHLFEGMLRKPEDRSSAEVIGARKPYIWDIFLLPESGISDLLSAAAAFWRCAELR